MSDDSSEMNPLCLASHARLRRDGPEGIPLVVLPERALKLNETGREVLELCDGHHHRAAIVSILRTRHPGAENLEREVSDFLLEMQKLGVVREAV